MISSRNQKKCQTDQEKSETGQHCGYRPDVPTDWSAKSQGGQMKEEL